MRSLTKHLWALHLATISLCAFFAARAAANAVAGYLLQAPPAKVRTQPVPRAPESHTPAPGVTRIIGRNIFCSTCEPVPEQKASEAAAGNESAGADTGPVASSLKLQLLATMVADDPSASLASILDPADNRVTIHGIGARLGGQASIIEIGARQVLLLNGRRQEILTLGEGTPGGERLSSGGEEGSPAASIASISGFRTPEPLEGLESIAAGIRRTGGTRYSIDRGVYSKIVSEPQALVGSGTAGREGKGMTVHAEVGSLPSLLGLFNGDVLQSINGQTVTSAERAAEILRGLSAASQITLSFMRKGVTLSHDYSIQ